jgi:restriction system protein
LPPIVKVQVKSGDGSIGRPKVQELFGTLGQGEYGLFISLGGFASQAKDFAKTRSTLRLIDGPALVELILEHYEELQPRYKALIPLKRVYIPQTKADGSLA